MIIIRVESQPCALSPACGHVFVETPNVAKGFYPNEWVGPLAWETLFMGVAASLVNFTGIVCDNSTHKFDPQNSYGYWACPKTVEAVECAIAKTEAEPPMYNYANIIYHNCAGQAAAWVEAGGLLAPYPASYPFLHPAPQGKRVFFIGRGSVLYRKTPAESIVGKNYNPLEH